ncbi:3-keto-5-aminohexanoate cleavage protein [soil metagenome]
MQEKIIIAAALTGSMASPHKVNPAVPVTPEQIANEALAARAAGAAVVHIHVRDPETGLPSMALELYEEVVKRIRDSGSDVLINLTTGAGARYRPDESDPTRASADSTMSSSARRVEHIVKLKPDICSLDVATMNFPQYAFVNLPKQLEEMAEMIQASGVKPELEVFDLGHAWLARTMVERGIIKGRPLFQLCMGVPWAAPGKPEAMIAMRNELPPGALWAGFGISSNEFPMVAQAAILGGHVRVGLEDNLYIAKGKLASGNAQLVERAVQIIESLGSQVATPAEAREILELDAC